MKQRELSEAETKARKKYDGMTRRQYNRTKGKFANLEPKSENGSFEVVTVFDGNPVEQTAPFPTMAAALSRFEKLSTNPNIRTLKVVKNVVTFNSKGEATGMNRVAIHTLHRLGQQFANSRLETIYRRPGGNETLTLKAIKGSPRLYELYATGQLEVVKQVATGGHPWWSQRA
jgi:hypothetical protein